jgi:hypothetical protein
MLDFSRNELNIHRAGWRGISMQTLMLGDNIRTSSSRLFFVSLSAIAGVACSLTVIAAEPVPQQTGAFLTYCKTNSEGCFNEIGDVSFGQLANVVENIRQRRWCPTDEPTDLKILVPKVVQWLIDHSEVHQMDTEKGIMTAIEKLYPYPCKS